ncbi:hypothetical protein METP3_03194 [Methanosarcinales archaeon]|nr:hypothetical protein METP3_03194 [Methanosarcinales archaeon]
MAQINHKLEIVAIVCFILISLSISIAYANPARGYELSIYESTPYIVWFFLIISIAGGVTIIAHQVYTREYNNSNFWLIGLMVLIISRITLLYIPYIRGYYTWNGDNISHIGYIKDILFTGYISSDNSYPIIHILLTALISISGAPVELIVNHSTALVSIFYVVSIYLLATAVSPTRGVQLLSVAAIGGVLFNGYDVYLMPNGWSVLYLSFVFFLFFKSLIKGQAQEYKLLLAVTLILFPFFHPLSSTILIVMLLTVVITQCLIYTIKYKKIFLQDISYHVLFYSILIVLTILLPWTLSFKKFNTNIRNLFDALTTGHGPEAIAEMGKQLDKINIHGLDLVNLVLKMYGDEIIFLILSFITVIILFKNQKERKNNNILIILLNITFVIGMMLALYLLNIIPGLKNIGAQRLESYLVIFTPILAGFALKHLISKKAYFNIVICIAVIMIASIISIFSLYQSPYIMYPNIEVTLMNMHGVKWFIDYKNIEIGSTEIMSPVGRFADGILGIDKSANRIDIRHTSNIPDHFNYTVNNKLGESYITDNYAVITQFDRQIYDTVWKEVGRFHKEDFEKIENDSSVDQLYSNGEVTAWYIHGIQ